jgi:hypothetical protein
LLHLCLHHNHLPLFTYLLSDCQRTHSYFTYPRLISLLNTASTTNPSAVPIILSSPTLQSLFLSRTLPGRLQLLTDFFQPSIASLAVQAQLLKEPWLLVTSIKALVKGAYSEAYRLKVLEVMKAAGFN